MLSDFSYTKERVDYIIKSFNNISEEVALKHLYSLGLLEMFAKIGMNFLLVGNMAAYLMGDENLYLPDNLEIQFHKRDFLDSYLKQINEWCQPVSFIKNQINEDFIIYQYIFETYNKLSVTIYLNVKLVNKLSLDVASIAIDKPFIINNDKIYRVKTVYAEKLIAKALFNFSPIILCDAINTNDTFELFIIKSLLDCIQLVSKIERFDYIYYDYYDLIDDFKEYYKLDENSKHFLFDSFYAVINIYCKGKYRKDSYKLLDNGIKAVQEFVISEKISVDNFFLNVGYPALIYACIYRNYNYLNLKISNRKLMLFYNYSKINDMKKYDHNVFNIIYQAIEIFDRLDIIEKTKKEIL